VAQIVIAGVGNELLSDDGVGIHAIRELQKNPIPGVAAVEIGTAILHGLHFLESAKRVLVIDAAMGGQPPGTIYQFDPAQKGEVKSLTSIHAMGLHEAMRFLQPANTLPCVTVVGVEPKSIEYSMNLSVPVQRALPQVVSLVRELVLGWVRAEIPCASESAARL